MVSLYTQSSCYLCFTDRKMRPVNARLGSKPGLFDLVFMLQASLVQNGAHKLGSIMMKGVGSKCSPVTSIPEDHLKSPVHIRNKLLLGLWESSFPLTKKSRNI